jgi:sugar lactone lactonase YvrE
MSRQGIADQGLEQAMNSLLIAITTYFRRSHRGARRIRTVRPKAKQAMLCLESLDYRIVPSALSVADVSVREGPTSTGILDPSGAASVGLNGTRGLVFDNGPTDAHYGDLFVAGYLSQSVARFDWASQTYQPFVTPGSGGLTKGDDLVFGPDGNLYVADNAQNTVFRYDGSTGAPLPAGGQTGAVFVNAGANGANNTGSIAFGPDGDLYVASYATNQILEYQGPAGSSPGAFLGVFLTVGNTGASSGATFVRFGPDGDLYVDVTNPNGTGQINRYDGTTGAPVGTGVFVPPGSGGLQSPREFFFDPTGTSLYVDSTAPVNQLVPPPTGQVLRFQGPNAQNPGAFIETYITSGQANVQFAIGLAQDAGGKLYVSDRDTANVARFAPSSQAMFQVTLDAPSASPVSVNYATADGTAVAGTDYSQTSGTLTFPAGVTSESVSVPVTTVATGGPTKTFNLNLSGASGATISRGQATASILNRQTKFFVVDSAAVRTFEYGSGGTSEEITTPLITNGGTDTAPRGVATTATGPTDWVVDANKNVYVYDKHGLLQGSWSAGGLSSSATLTGIATNGTDIWLVDSYSDKAYKYAGAASLRSGSQSASSSFKLNRSDTNPQDIVTDGTSFWVVDSSALKVFKYTLSGSLLGSWSIDPANKNPTGITINPSNVSDIWIVDNVTLKVYDYAGAGGRTSGSQNASATFALNTYDTNPQGIADPSVGGVLPSATPTLSAASVPTSAPLAPAFGRASALVPSPTGQDARWAALVGGDMAKVTSAPSLQFTSNGTIAAAFDRVAAPLSESAGTQSGDPRTAVASAILAGAGSEPGADDLLIDALTKEDSQASATVTDSFFALLADQPLRAE